MNQMDEIPAEPADSRRDGRSSRHDGRRRELMDRAIAYVLREGFGGLSLRPMAESMGISHRTLLHHFGSKEAMLERVLAELRERELRHLNLRALEQQQDPVAMVDASWAQLSAPERLPFWRAFFEIYAQAVKHPEQHAEFLEGVVKAWLPALTQACVARGVLPERAETIATVMTDGCRGLMIDLLTTGETARVSRAYAVLHELLQRELDAAAGT
ncbi:TetR/AcrR family transcriptional regulator [Solimonas sp. K1W22B-7]|uniref:TetR/AcrR family transcriptional regulator n=1 Tax=Solimonas sp. K1W22B-7 TaxID=2303331 RepID=UPI000E33716B|nr:TetR/AcrR family transcriptional regulator [Solimonas sp. K1W22B-7]AXQ28747.1 TetR/AcrR family transcriptional regulator [Solimonas sp. K1W22B-7]